VIARYAPGRSSGPVFKIVFRWWWPIAASTAVSEKRKLEARSTPWGAPGAGVDAVSSCSFGLLFCLFFVRRCMIGRGGGLFGTLLMTFSTRPLPPVWRTHQPFPRLLFSIPGARSATAMPRAPRPRPILFFDLVWRARRCIPTALGTSRGSVRSGARDEHSDRALGGGFSRHAMSTKTLERSLCVLVIVGTRFCDQRGGKGQSSVLQPHFAVAQYSQSAATLRCHCDRQGIEELRARIS